MKIILLEDVKTLGKKGVIVEVNDGYARNFVIPKKLGIEATGKNLNDLKLKSANDDRIALEILDKAKEFSVELGKKTIKVQIKAGTGGKTFGSISSKEIAKAAFEQHGIELDKKKIQLNDPIKNFGTYEVKVKIHPKVIASLNVVVQEEK